jgi:ribosome-binding protein aMBF1 (putative translation factor)
VAARRKTPLRAATEADAKAAEEQAKKPKTVTEAAASGTTRELFVAMRERIALAVEDKNTPARELAALTKRLVEVVRDIEAIDAREEQDAKTGNQAAPDEALDAEAL